ncbi:hypothetical protein OIU84_020276 [Salix udensis]|uniref:Endonuclease/exonuclease/phosphatase domain-containing protein n=1 Tax=Salix udensis TaxID=889485 RepID=A0AAD6J6F5_9ROSI|nr:hypothetical protein OIU84_020276 [Salix udensis]
MNSSLTVSFIYGLHTPADRQELWDYISSQSTVQGHNAWVLMGDFNASLKASDSSGGAISWTGHQQDFGNCLYKAHIHSLPYKGLKYTWHNGQEQNSMIVKKLDWVLGNYALLTKWPNAQAEFFARTVSDHNSMVLRLLPSHPSFPPQFKFLNLWTDQEEFLPIVTNAWQSRVEGNDMFKFTSKLKIVKAHLTNWHRNNRRDISGRVVKARGVWEKAQELLDKEPRDERAKMDERAATYLYHRLLQDERIFF